MTDQATPLTQLGEALTTPEYAAKVAIRQAWFTAHGFVPEQSRAEVDALIAAIEAAARRAVEGSGVVSVEALADALREVFHPFTPPAPDPDRLSMEVPSVDDLFSALQAAVRGKWGQTDREIAESMHEHLAARARALRVVEEVERITEKEWSEYVDHLVAGTTPSLVLDYILRDLRAALAQPTPPEGERVLDWNKVGPELEALGQAIADTIDPASPMQSNESTMDCIEHLWASGFRIVRVADPTPPATDPDRLRALEAALERLRVATNRLMQAWAERPLKLLPGVMDEALTATAAARALLAEGERSE